MRASDYTDVRVSRPPTGMPGVIGVMGISMGSLISLGLARLAFSLLVPSMRTDLGWSYELIGWLGAALTAGYLVGAFAVPSAVAIIGSRGAFLGGMVVTTIALFATGGTSDIWIVAGLRVLAGFSTAFVFVVGSTLLAASSPTPSRARFAMCLFLGFGGLGMMITAFAVPFVADRIGWTGGWLVIGTLAALCTIVAIPATLNSTAPPTSTNATTKVANASRRGLWPTYLSYTFFGAGYLAFATFVVAYLRFQLQFSAQEIAVYWGICGAAGLASSFLWLPILTRFAGGHGIALLNFWAAAGALLTAFAHSRIGIYVSAAMFGLSFLTVAAAVLNFARRAVPPHLWTRTMSLLTVCFSIGQCIGPTAAGMAFRGLGVTGGIIAAVVLLGLAGSFALLQSEPARQ